jgi:hypothetical protein
MTEDKNTFRGTGKFSKDFDFQNLSEGEFCERCGWVKGIHDYAHEKACPINANATNPRSKHISSLGTPTDKESLKVGPAAADPPACTPACIPYENAFTDDMFSNANLRKVISEQSEIMIELREKNKKQDEKIIEMGEQILQKDAEIAEKRIEITMLKKMHQNDLEDFNKKFDRVEQLETMFRDDEEALEIKANEIQQLKNQLDNAFNEMDQMKNAITIKDKIIENDGHKLSAAHEQTVSSQQRAAANFARVEKAELRADILRGALNDLRVLYADQSAAYTQVISSIVDQE